MSKKSTRKRHTIAEGETKAERFTRVVSPRVSKAVKAIKTIGYCAGGTYEYTPEQVSQIISSLLAAVNIVKQNYESKKATDEIFSFAD